jgi:hypothetical protein
MVLMTRVLVTMQMEILIDWDRRRFNRFTALGTALADQYSALHLGVHVDGKFTLEKTLVTWEE